MPLSTVCVSTVSGRPRLWSSYSNIRIKDLKDEPSFLVTMNSTDEISSYRNAQDFYQSPTLSNRTLGHSYDFPAKSTKKEKKWTLGNLFRRKRKDESDSSSDDDQKRGFLGRRRRKSQEKRKKPTKPVGTFDHVVLPRNTIAYSGYNHHEDTGILSDPSYGFSRITAPPSNPLVHSQSNNTSFVNGLNNSIRSVTSVGSADSLTKKSLRKMTKARAVARRTTLGNESSSDDDSHLSSSSIRMRSDESLARFADSSHNKRSRAARTERYLKRHSRDGENPSSYLKLSDDSSKSPSRSPNLQINQKNIRPYQPSLSSSQHSNLSGISTIPPSHGVHAKYRVSNSTSNPSYKPPLSMNEYNSSLNQSPNFSEDKYFNQRSVSCDANIHKAPSLEGNNVLHVQFPIIRPNVKGYRNLSLVDPSQVNSARYPPQPPPRDPNRFVVPHYFENGRPNTYYFENNTNQSKNKSFHGYLPSNSPQGLQQKSNSFNFHPSLRSNSDMHLPRDPYQVQTVARPASTTPEPKLNKYNNKRNERHTVDTFNYLTEKKPRSRKPIFIQENSNQPAEDRKDSPTQKALDFWKQKIEANVNKSINQPHASLQKSQSGPQMFTSTTQVKTQVFLPSVLSPNPSKRLKLPQNPSPFKPVSPTVKEVNQTFEIPKSCSSPLSSVPKIDLTRKSTNLEEALDELEAIYNSLRLGDEDLLDRAEQREKENAVQQMQETNKETALLNNVNRGALSDSNYSYEPFDQVDSPKRKKVVKKNKIPDTKEDDMYNRKIVKEKAKTISDPQAALNAVSYLLASPLHNINFDDPVEVKNKKNREPDITYDDVVFRNVKRLLSSPKTVDPQPPFGIPLGPVAPAPNTDYLHAVPCEIYQPPYKSRKIPDVVKDDLAFRNLRKDANKEPALPPALNDNIKGSLYHNENKLDLNYFKKRRAVRSMSANIGNILAKKCVEDHENEFKNLTDIADAMEIARRVLQEKGKNIAETKKAFLSDTDVKPDYANGDSFKESRQKFLNDLKNVDDNAGSLGSKPPPTPRGPTPDRKSSTTPTKDTHSKSPLDTESTNSSLDDLLNALAVEAKITTDRITKELEELELQKKFREREEEERKKQLNIVDFCRNCAKNKEVDVKIAVKEPSEIVKPIDLNPVLEERAQLVQSPYKPSESERDDLSETKVNLSEPDYENIDSDVSEKKSTVKPMPCEPEYEVLESDTSELKKEMEKPFEKCGSPFVERKAELVATFQDLKKDIDEIKVPNFKKSEKDTKTDSVYDNLDDTSNETNDVEGELKVCQNKLSFACDLPNNETNPVVFTSMCEIFFKHQDTADTSSSDTISLDGKLDTLESLKSPKLVLETTKKCSKGKKLSDDENKALDFENSVHNVTSNHQNENISGFGSSNMMPTKSLKVVETNFDTKNRTLDSPRPNSKPSRDQTNLARPSSRARDFRSPCMLDSDSSDCKRQKWYREPATVALACTYGVACVHQMASIDFAAILSILLAVISFIAALFI